MARGVKNGILGFSTFKVERANSPIYTELLARMDGCSLFIPNGAEIHFRNKLSSIVKEGKIEAFEVPMCDPSVNNGHLSFAPFRIPATGFSPEELEELAQKNGLRIGNFSEYILYCAALLNTMIQRSNLKDAWKELKELMKPSPPEKILRTGCMGIPEKRDF